MPPREANAMRAQFTVTPAEAGFDSPENSTSDGYFAN
jgi:hypothetical protein